MGFAPVQKLTRDERAFYQKLLKDEELSLRSAEHWQNVFMVLTVIFGSAFFVTVLLWSAKVI